MAKIGIIGGSGLYQIEGLKNVKEVAIKTPFGDPSDKFVIGKLADTEVAFLPRHGKGHRISPSELNFRANIFGMKKLGVEQIISVTACGSLKEELKPLDFVIPDQFVDRTNKARQDSFFTGGIVAHVVFADPICKDLATALYSATRELGIKAHFGGTYLNMEGPAFSTRAESELYRKWGMDIIGMTNLAEAKLAREAEICYATLAAVTDFDCWHQTEEDVSIDMVIQNLQKNIENAKKILQLTIPRLDKPRTCECKDAMKFAVVTAKDMIPAKVKKDLSLIIGKYIK
ncbi:MAG TPA: S-methyl-5'-thioadenosine phosphorylase [Candidatus Omnitrophota bacterium]|nr:S-methyl-5'-thioadenosine phosphorylase [Candidatus Omnitrophota bacterium]